MKKSIRRVVAATIALLCHGWSLPAQSAPSNDPALEQPRLAAEAEAPNPIPLGDENVPSMYSGILTPEQADAYSLELQQARLLDPNASIEVIDPLGPQPKGIIYSETIEGQLKFYTYGKDGTKEYFPPTSSVNFTIAHSQDIQAVVEGISSVAKSQSASLIFALLTPKRSLLDIANVATQAVVYAVSGTPPQCPPSGSDNCSIVATYGQMTGPSIPDTHVFANLGYDYAPTVMWDEGKYKIWWCGSEGTHGDHILYAESSAVGSIPPFNQGTWTYYGSVFAPLGPLPPPPAAPTNGYTGAEFDAGLTCDPSVVKVGGMYYMYYGGLPLTTYVPWSNTTRIGAAYSIDGKTWHRWTTLTGAPHGSPIISTHIAGASLPTYYGSGHPSVVFVNGYFYMSFDDDTGATHPGQYALRSTDPFFQTEVDEWQRCGTGCSQWVPLGGAPTTAHTYTGSYNVDWSYSQSTHEWVVSINGIGVIDPTELEARGTHSSIRVFDKSLLTETHPVAHVQAQWVDGPGIATYSNGAMLQTANCDTHWIRVLRGGRDWPNANHAACETNFHNFLATDGVLDPTNKASYKAAYIPCVDMSYEGWDLSTGISWCRANYAGALVIDDYDGDKVSDPVVWRPSSGVWWTRKSSSNQQHGEQWGVSTDQPIFGADFDGDRIADHAYKRPSNSTYYILPSTGTCQPPLVPHVSTRGCSWNSGWTSTDIPVPADYDGDGKTDIAARSVGGGLHYIPSSGGACPAPFTSATYSGVAGCSATAGTTGDKPLVGDYNGDGRTDIAWHSPSGGSPPTAQIWVRLTGGGTCPPYFATSGSNCYTNTFLTTDVPVTGDFDGDGISDIMWWDTAGLRFNTWGLSAITCPVNFTNAGTYCYLPFGLSGDVPLGKQFNPQPEVEPTVWRPNISGFSWWFTNRTNSSSPVGIFWNASLPAPNAFETQWGLPSDRVEGLR